MPDELPSVAGDRMTKSHDGFQRACQVALRDEQEKIAPDNHLISILCEAVRLSREHVALKTSLGFDRPWAAVDCLKILAKAAHHLLDDHNHDATGWEEIQHAADSADQIVADFEKEKL